MAINIILCLIISYNAGEDGDHDGRVPVKVVQETTVFGVNNRLWRDRIAFVPLFPRDIPDGQHIKGVTTPVDASSLGHVVVPVPVGNVWIASRADNGACNIYVELAERYYQGVSILHGLVAPVLGVVEYGVQVDRDAIFIPLDVGVLGVRERCKEFRVATHEGGIVFPGVKPNRDAPGLVAVQGDFFLVGFRVYLACPDSAFKVHDRNQVLAGGHVDGVEVLNRKVLGKGLLVKEEFIAGRGFAIHVAYEFHKVRRGDGGKAITILGKKLLQVLPFQKLIGPGPVHRSLQGYGTGSLLDGYHVSRPKEGILRQVAKAMRLEVVVTCRFSPTRGNCDIA